MHCLGENTEMYKSFSVTIDDKEIDDEEIDDKEPIEYKLRFINSFRFIKSSLDKLVDNLSEINNKTCTHCKERSKTTQYYEFVKLSEDSLMYKCLKCKEKSYKPIKPQIDKLSKTYGISNYDNEKFILLLRKGVYPYEYMDDWKRFNETELPLKEAFISNLNMTNISDKDYEHVKKVWNTFNIENLGEYCDLYVESDTFLLADVFETFSNTCINIYGLDPTYFVYIPGVAWTAMLKVTTGKLELLTDVDMLLMFEEGTRGEISQAIHKYAKANNKYMKSYNKNIISSYLQYLDANNLYG